MDDLAKLAHMIEHWIEHNADHSKTYREWAAKAKSAGNAELARLMAEIADAQDRMAPLFEAALKASAGAKGSHHHDHGHDHGHGHSHGHKH